MYVLACLPLLGQGPHVWPLAVPDPAFFALSWLWFVPVALSAIHEPWSVRRFIQSVVYALVISVILDWAMAAMDPSPRGSMQAIAVLPLVFAVEGLSRVALLFSRCFPLALTCQSCGYSLRGLSKPRCPECGAEFPVVQLDPSATPPALPLFGRRTTCFILVVLAIAVAIVAAYRVHYFRAAADLGQRMAEKDWASGTAIWYVTGDELAAMSPAQMDRVYELLGLPEPDTGLKIKQTSFRNAHWWRGTWQTHYRQVIERKLKKAGLSRPSFEPRS